MQPKSAQCNCCAIMPTLSIVFRGCANTLILGSVVVLAELSDDGVLGGE